MIKRVQDWIHGHKRLTAIMLSAMMIMSVMAVGVSANDGAGGASADLDAFITSIKGALADFTTTNLAKILVAALSITCGLAIAWFAFRFIKAKTSSALKKGKL